MICGSMNDIFFYDYEKYGYSDSDFEELEDENVVAECEYKEIKD